MTKRVTRSGTASSGKISSLVSLSKWASRSSQTVLLVNSGILQTRPKALRFRIGNRNRNPTSTVYTQHKKKLKKKSSYKTSVNRYKEKNNRKPHR